MVKYSEKRLDRIFSALSDSTRREILSKLTKGESTVSELAEPFDMSLPAITKHLNVLEEAGLIHREKDGRIHRCKLDVKPLMDADIWIQNYKVFWDKQFVSLEKYLNQSSIKKEKK